MATDYGTTIACVNDLVAPSRFVSGQRAVAEAIARRLQTPRGALIDSRDYGFDLRDYVNADLTRPQMAALLGSVTAECQKDERVESADVTIRFLGETELRVTINLMTAVGPFTLVMSIDQYAARIANEV